MENNLLTDFQTILLSRGFAPPKNAPFYANWVSKFIAFSNQYEEDLPEGPLIKTQSLLIILILR
jgi:hypothetical protein